MTAFASYSAPRLFALKFAGREFLFARRLLLLVLLFAAGLPAKSASKVESIPLYGERFISLQKWARAKNFSIAWDQPKKSVVVSSKWSKLEFTVDSKRAVFNGVVVWLTTGITAHKNTVYISERDVYTLLHPILYPARHKNKVRTIAIAAGHGGKDPGNMINKYPEKKYTLELAKVLKETLERAGFKVVMTRSSDVFVELEDQTTIARKAGADVFINVHYNAASEVEAKGVETFCLTPEGAVSTHGGSRNTRWPGHKQNSANALLAYHVQKALINGTDFVDRGVKRAAFQVLREVTMPAVLIEGGFLSNPFDAEKIMHPVQRRKTAQAITDGILSYKRLVERK